ncbi:MAG: CHAD domain-containing protein [Proteobacteria bacterium]|nr:CHAD domain-containing protein [Pseudomonadota bacterium]
MAEIELKLRGSPARLKAVLKRLQQRARKGSAFKKDLRAVYFDTAKDDLHAKGISFRVREEGERFVQTLKQTSAGGDALTRGEWSDRVAAAAPELLNTHSGRKLRQVWKDIRLLPRFRTDIARSGFVISPKAHTEIEVVRDEGNIHAVGRDDGVAAVSEIEIELKKGPRSAIYDLALEIVATAGVQIEPLGKADRGYALLSPGAAIVSVKAESPKARGRDTLAETLRSAARRHFAQFLANMAGALRQDPASIHQMRVSMRRLRAALYGARNLLPEAEYESVRLKLKYLLQSLGAARDWEVLTERLSELEDEEDIESVQRAAGVQKGRALVRAVDAVGSRKNIMAVLEAMRWFEDLPTARHGRKLKVRARDAAGDILSELFDRVRRRGRHFEEQSVGDRHRLRIAGKNLRYNVELYAALYPKRKVERFLDLLKPVQDDLGHLNDVSRARDLLGELAKRSPQKAAAAAVVARLEARVTAADKRARKHVANLRNAKLFW